MLKFSEEHRRKLREASARRGPRPKHTEETKRKMSESRRRGIAEGRIIPKGGCGFRDPAVRAKARACRKPDIPMRVVCRGITYDSPQAVADHNRVSRSCVYFQLSQYGHLDFMGARNNPHYEEEWKAYKASGKYIMQ